MMRRNEQTRRRRAGFTLAEAGVAVATAVIVFGLAMGVLMKTNQTVNRSLSHESLLQQAELGMKEIRSVVEATAWPDDFATSGSAPTPLVFGKDRLGIWSSHNPASGRFCFFTLRMTPGDKGKPRAVCERSLPGGTPPPNPTTTLGGEFETTLSFRYATQVGADLQPAWQESLPAGQKPRLIWVELLLRGAEYPDMPGRRDEVRLATAIAL